MGIAATPPMPFKVRFVPVPVRICSSFPFSPEETRYNGHQQAGQERPRGNRVLRLNASDEK